MAAHKRILITGGSGFIGTNAMETFLQEPGIALLNLDRQEPQDKSQLPFWKSCDLLDEKSVLEEMQNFQPTEVIHLAARTDMFGKTVDDYAANHVGTAVVAAAIAATPSVKRVVFTSSQFVVGPGVLPKDDFDFRPHTIYGQSKVLSEKAIRAAELQCTWTIIRPTNIWGKWHPRYPFEFWRVVKDGRYVHPGGERVVRCYGYVGNVVHQIQTILAARPATVHHRVFYVGDPPIDLFEWANAFSLELRGSEVRVVPRLLLMALAKVGDAVNAIGGKFPIFSSRYRSMTESYITPMQPTFEALGQPPISLSEGVRETGKWLRELAPHWR